MQPIFARIIKVDEARQEVTGCAVQEVVDRDNEIFDYKTSKPEFMKWSAEVHADTNGQSLGNVRSMHGNVCAGKLTDMEFDDANKSINVTAKIVDPTEWKKVTEGCYSGFSIGGRYARKWAEPINGKMIQRYTAVPSEISIVDRPCIPTAKFHSMSKGGFEFVKRDGSVEERSFNFLHAVNYEDGKFVVLAKGGPGSGPQGGSGKLAMFASTRAVRHSNRSSTKTSAKATAKAHEATKIANKENTYDAHSNAAALHDKAAAAHDGKNNAASWAHDQAASLHTEAAYDHARTFSSGK